MKVSIIIPTYNHFSDLLRPCLETVEKYTDLKDKEIIIVSNGSTDETVPYIEYRKKCGLPYKVFDYPKPLGFPRANNVGAFAAQGEYLVLLNNDALILPCVKDAWINIMMDPFEIDSKVGVSGPVATVNVDTNRFFIIFVCAMVKRTVWEQLNGMDEIFNPGYGDDVDFCIRAEMAGHKLVKVPVGGRVIQDKNLTLVDFPIKHLSFGTFKDHVKLQERLRKSGEILFKRYGKIGEQI